MKKNLEIFKKKNILYGLKDENGKIIKEPFADWIYEDGIFKMNGKWGIVNLKTGKIIKEPFADFIHNGHFEVNGKYGILNFKNGKIIKEAV